MGRHLECCHIESYLGQNNVYAEAEKGFSECSLEKSLWEGDTRRASLKSNGFYQPLAWGHLENHSINTVLEGEISIVYFESNKKPSAARVEGSDIVERARFLLYCGQPQMPA